MDWLIFLIVAVSALTFLALMPVIVIWAFEEITNGSPHRK